MKIVIFALILFFSVALCQIRPKVVEVFTARCGSEIHDGNKTAIGGGFVAYDTPSNRAAELFEFDYFEYDYRAIERYDLGFSYLVNIRMGKCVKNAVKGNLPPVFAWVEKAKYVGRKDFFRRQIDFWEYIDGNQNYTLGVSPSNANIPVVSFFSKPNFEFGIEYFHFNATKPDLRDFFVPPICN